MIRFAFAVSFKPRSACVDWEQAQANLRRTLRSASATGATESVLLAVACHDEPELHELSEVVQLLPVPFDEPADQWEGVRDKARKRRFIGSWLRETLAVQQIYVMFLDADDLVHREIVGHTLAHGQGSYVVDHGYVLDLESGLLWHRRHDFNKTCGSSFVFRFALEELPTSWEDADSPYSQFGSPPDQRGHEEYDAVATDLGRPPAGFPFPAALYSVNHSESLWRAKSGGRRNSASPRDFVWPREARRVLVEEFSAPDLARRAAGLERVSSAFTRAASRRVWARARGAGSKARRRLLSER